MAHAPGPQAGGIAGLVSFLRESGGTVEADLRRHFDVNLSDLAVGRMTWRQLRVYVEALAEWDTRDHLLALILDALQIANWQRTEDGAKGRNRPTAIPRPGVRDDRDTVGRTDRSPEEVKAYLARFAPETEGAVTDDG